MLKELKGPGTSVIEYVDLPSHKHSIVDDGRVLSVWGRALMSTSLYCMYVRSYGNHLIGFQGTMVLCNLESHGHHYVRKMQEVMRTTVLGNNGTRFWNQVQISKLYISLVI